MRMGGRPAPFGMDEESLDQVLDAVLAEPELDLCGVHLFTGTQILDAATLHNQYRHGLELARRVVKRLGRPLRTLDFGGVTSAIGRSHLGWILWHSSPVQ